jgi:hypothetical protein
MLPPGVVGREQLIRSPDSVGYVQPVEIRLPDEATVAIADGGGFSSPHLSRLKVGLTVGNVYRLKVTQIPHNLAGEVYPTVEIIGRLRPPAGLENKFPIPIQITQRDLEHALAGRFVVRVVFLEDPQKAYPEIEDKNEQRTIMALDEEDPLRLAEELGRPMAILRLGSRVPDTLGLDSHFLFGSPPVTYLTPSTDVIGIPVEMPSYEAPANPNEAFEVTPEIEVTPIVPESGEFEIETGTPDQPTIEKRDTAPDAVPHSQIVPDDPFADDPFTDDIVDELPQP